MSLIFTDGFEVEGTGTPAVYTKWSSSLANVVITTTQARTGSRALSGSSGHNCVKAFPPSQTNAGMIVGFAVFRSSGDLVLRLGEASSTIHVQLTIATDGSISVTRAGTGTSAFTLPTNTIESSKWYYLELKAVINDSTGSVELKIDGTTRGSVSGVDTRNGGTYSKIEYMQFVFNSTFYVDDLYVVTLDSIAPNDFLGDVKIYTIFPTGAGSYTQFTPSTGSNWSTVDDTGNPNTTDYVSGSGMYKIDSYAYGDITASISGQVIGVMANMYANRTGSYGISVGATATLAGQTIVSSGQPLNNAGYWYQMALPTTPASGSWTISDINNAEFGFQIIGSGV